MHPQSTMDKISDEKLEENLDELQGYRSMDDVVSSVAERA